MFGISKGDIIFEPLELLAEFLVRLFGKALYRTFPSGQMDSWEWPQWLWVAFLVSVASWAIWFLFRKGRQRSA